MSRYVRPATADDSTRTHCMHSFHFSRSALKMKPSVPIACSIFSLAVAVEGFSQDYERGPTSARVIPEPKPKHAPITTSKYSTTAAGVDRRSILSGLASAAAFTAACPPLPASATPSTLASAPDDIDGIAAVTRSSLGTSIRKATVRSAQIADKLDEGWERFSDSLRDENKCDPNTGRRMFDNGVRKDGSRIGNPVLGGLCEPEPLLPLRDAMAATVLESAEDALAGILGIGKDAIKQQVANVDRLVGPSFVRAQDASSEDERKRSGYNRKVYSTMRAYGDFLLTNKDPRTARLAAANFELKFGERLLFDNASPLVPARLANRQSFKSPFPPLSEEDRGDLAYEEGALLDALGTLSSALDVLQAGGIIGHWEIAIPYDDYGEVVTIAVDDDISLGAQSLLREGQGLSLNGSVVTALTRASLKHFGIDTAIDAFFLDPSTTKQDIYNPTQLLLNLSNIRASTR